MKDRKRLFIIGGAALVLAIALICFLTANKTPDYSKPENWAYYAVGPEKSADLFLICPTVDMGGDGNYNMSLNDEKTKANFVGALNMERGIYENELTMYAPFYRQASFPVYSLASEKAKPYFELAYKDVRSAFLYYIKNSPQDRPFVLAGFSQGADMALRLLKEFFHDPVYEDRLIAAYCIGWRVTDEDVAAYPQLKCAEGEYDTGVIVSFSTEAVDINDSLIVPEGVKTHAINPLNWKTDAEFAPAAENLGACFTDYYGNIQREISGLTGAYIDEKRGTLKATDIDPKDYSNSLFPDGVYHLYDYQFFYRDLQNNVKVRTEAYFEQREYENAA